MTTSATALSGQTTTAMVSATPMTAAMEALDPASKPDTLAPADRDRVEEIKQTVDLASSTSVLNFGAASEHEVAQFADSVLGQVMAKDIGPMVHDRLTEIKFLAQGVQPQDLDGGGGFLGKLFFDIKKEITKFSDRFQSARSRIDSIAASLEDQIHELNLGLVVLDRLFEQNLRNFKELTLHIVAGHEMLAHYREHELPRMETEARAKANDPDGMMLGQRTRDLKAAIERLDRKVMNLEKSKAIAFATMPTIRQVQQTGILLVEELKMALAHAIPAWKSTMVVYVEQLRQKAGLETLSAMTDFTDDQLQRMARQLDQNTVDIQRQTQRGIADVQVITETIGSLVQTLNKVDDLEKEARQAREAGRSALAQAEAELRAVQTSAA